tara:strand:+ start:505 stop:714 length:210 start_codon:yes stop_codon:yes gene_type:complete
MEIKYSGHAEKRLIERGMEKWEVEHILKFPSYVKKSIEGKRIAVGESKGREIKIVFIDMEKYKKIVSVM